VSGCGGELMTCYGDLKMTRQNVICFELYGTSDYCGISNFSEND